MLQRGMDQMDRVFPILHASDADRGMGITMRHGNGNGRDPRQRFLDGARIVAASTGLAQLIRDRLGSRGFL